MRTILGMTLLGGSVLAGCVASEPDIADDPDTSETAQAITSFSFPFFSGAELDLGSDADKTCFLQGIKGSLRGAESWQSPEDELETAGAGVFDDPDHHWRIRTDPGLGPGVAVKVGCIPNVGGRVFIQAHQTGNQSFSSVQAASKGRQCFLTSVNGRGYGWMTLMPGQPPLKPAVWLDDDAPGPSWRIHVNLAAGSSATENGLRGGATAVCVTVVAPNPLDFSFDGLGGSVKLPIPASQVADFTCGLHTIAGVIDHPISERGIELFHNGSPDWFLSLRSDYSTKVHCIQ